MKGPTINLLSSRAQTMSRGNNNFIILGLDAEILPRTKRGVVWPHQQNCPQTRGDKRWSREIFDWHGDGYAFELCVPPTYCLDVMLRNVGQGMAFLQGKYGDVRIEVPTIYEVPARVAASAPAEVRRLGCMPSFNVYDDPGKPGGLSKTERTTGCHLHASHPWLDHDKAKLCVKWADIIVGNAWNYISPEDSSVEEQRRRAYGRAGEHRRNRYPNEMFGFEYRALPGRVLGNPPYLTAMFNLLRHAIHLARAHGEPPTLLSTASRAAINKADKPLSEAILAELPFTRESRVILKAMHDHPLKPLTAQEWYNAGENGEGHVDLYWRSLDDQEGGE